MIAGSARPVREKACEYDDEHLIRACKAELHSDVDCDSRCENAPGADQRQWLLGGYE